MTTSSYSPPALRARLKFLVIDDHSDEPLRLDKGELDLRLVRVDDDIDWNMPGCRNLAATLCETPWMLFFDVDNVASEASLLKIVDNLPRLDKGRLIDPTGSLRYPPTSSVTPPASYEMPTPI